MTRLRILFVAHGSFGGRRRRFLSFGRVGSFVFVRSRRFASGHRAARRRLFHFDAATDAEQRKSRKNHGRQRTFSHQRISIHVRNS